MALTNLDQLRSGNLITRDQGTRVPRGAPTRSRVLNYQGMVFHRTHNIAKSAKHMLGPFMAGCHRIRQFAREEHLIDRPHALLFWLNATLFPPVCMLATRGTRFMKKGSEFDSPLQTAHLCFLKGVLGVNKPYITGL